MRKWIGRIWICSEIFLKCGVFMCVGLRGRIQTCNVFELWPFLHLEEQSAAQRATLELRKDLVPRASFGGSSCRLTIRYGSFDPCRAGSIGTKSWSWKILSQVSPKCGTLSGVIEVITWCLIVYWLHLTTVYKMNQSFLGKYSASCVVLPLSSVLILVRSFTSRGDM